MTLLRHQRLSVGLALAVAVLIPVAECGLASWLVLGSVGDGPLPEWRLLLAPALCGAAGAHLVQLFEFARGAREGLNVSTWLQQTAFLAPVLGGLAGLLGVGALAAAAEMVFGPPSSLRLPGLCLAAALSGLMAGFFRLKSAR